MPRSVRRSIPGFGVALPATLCVLALAPAAKAAQIAEWNFDDGTADDSIGAYDLSPVGGGPSISGGIALFDGDEASPSYLETGGPGGSPNWSIAMRIRSGTPFDQGAWQGIFSNNSVSTANYSWQVESSGGRYQFRTTGAVYDIGAPAGDWDTIVIRKLGGNVGVAGLVINKDDGTGEAARFAEAVDIPVLASIPADEDIRRKSANYQIIGTQESPWGSLFAALGDQVATAPPRLPKPLDQDGLLDLFKAENVGRDVVLEPATLEDLCGPQGIAQRSLEVVYDTL